MNPQTPNPELLRQWVRCPVCGEPDMRQEADPGGHGVYIHCVNLSCASNGGENASALSRTPATEPAAAAPSGMSYPWGWARLAQICADSRYSNEYVGNVSRVICASLPPAAVEPAAAGEAGPVAWVMHHRQFVGKEHITRSKKIVDSLTASLEGVTIIPCAYG